MVKIFVIFFPLKLFFCITSSILVGLLCPKPDPLLDNMIALIYLSVHFKGAYDYATINFSYYSTSKVICDSFHCLDCLLSFPFQISSLK